MAERRQLNVRVSDAALKMLEKIQRHYGESWHPYPQHATIEKLIREKVAELGNK